MIYRRTASVALAVALSVLLAGCQTTSFGPPHVEITRGAGTGSVSPGCEIAVPSAMLKEDVQGGLYLIDNFVHVYRCAVRQAANSRQAFEVPALLIGAGAALAAAFGAGPDVAIAGGGGVAILNAGKSYYSPGESTNIYQRGLDAITCIGVEAAGVPAFAPLATEPAGDQRNVGGRQALGSVSIGAQQQYFRMVRGALLSTESIVAQRLSKRGSFDPAGLVAEIGAIRERIEQAEAAAGVATADDGVSDGEAGSATGDAQDGAEIDDAVDVPSLGTPEESRARRRLAIRSARSTESLIQLDLQVMRPRLQECVVRAKL